jgi:U3 small nucleolar RNA-associated protein 22
MEPDAFTNSMDLKVREFLKEVRLDHSPAFTKLVDDTVSAIKDAIDKIPEDLKVSQTLRPILCLVTEKMENFEFSFYVSPLFVGI